MIMDYKTLSFSALTFEFLRLLALELKDRQFTTALGELRTSPPNGEIISATGIQSDVLMILPELARDFAARIKPQYTHCYKLAHHPAIPQSFTASEPISGLSIRCVRVFAAIHRDFVYRFDAGFS